MPLHNHIDRHVLKQRMQTSTEARTTLSFYQYARIVNPTFFRDYLYEQWDNMGVLGRAYVAHEGINAQISVPNEALASFEQAFAGHYFLTRNPVELGR